MHPTLPPEFRVEVLAWIHPLLSDPLTAMIIGFVQGAAVGAILATLSASWVRRSKTGASLGLTKTVGLNGRDAAEDARALAVLQAEHDRLQSEMAQRARQIARLEAELRAAETASLRESDELRARVESEKAGREAALAEAARLKIELTQMQSIAAQIPGLEAQLSRLLERH